MVPFKAFFEQEQVVEQAQSLFELHQPVAGNSRSAKKDQIVDTWQKLRPNLPIVMTPINNMPGRNDHSTFDDDGLRITGSWQFIASILSRIKDVLTLENPRNKLRLVFRGVQAPGQLDGNSPPQSYVFYVHLQNRGVGKVPHATILKPGL